MSGWLDEIEDTQVKIISSNKKESTEMTPHQEIINNLLGWLTSEMLDFEMYCEGEESPTSEDYGMIRHATLEEVEKYLLDQLAAVG